MAEATVFNLKDGEIAERKYLVTAVNVGESGSPEWEIVGVTEESSAIEHNVDKEKKTNILGITNTTVNKLESTQSLDPFSVRGGSKLQVKLYNQLKYLRLSEMAMYEVMIIHAYVGTEGKYEAEVHSGCTISVSSQGGESKLDMPIEIDFSNNKTHGTVDKYKYGETITFTAA